MRPCFALSFNLCTPPKNPGYTPDTFHHLTYIFLLFLDPGWTPMEHLKNALFDRLFFFLNPRTMPRIPSIKSSVSHPRSLHFEHTFISRNEKLPILHKKRSKFSRKRSAISQYHPLSETQLRHWGDLHGAWEITVVWCWNVKEKLNFLAAILDFWRPSWIYNGYLISLYSIYGNKQSFVPILLLLSQSEQSLHQLSYFTIFA